jgi:hypothetical protein
LQPCCTSIQSGWVSKRTGVYLSPNLQHAFVSLCLQSKFQGPATVAYSLCAFFGLQVVVGLMKVKKLDRQERLITGTAWAASPSSIGGNWPVIRSVGTDPSFFSVVRCLHRPIFVCFSLLPSSPQRDVA